MPPRNPKPAPVVVETRCSLCDLPWEDHSDDPTTADCIRLLKAQLAVRPTVVYVDRWYPHYAPTITPAPWYSSGDTFTIDCDTIGSSTGGALTLSNVSYLTPRDEEPPDAVGAIA